MQIKLLSNSVAHVQLKPCPDVWDSVPRGTEAARAIAEGKGKYFRALPSHDVIIDGVHGGYIYARAEGVKDDACKCKVWFVGAFGSHWSDVRFTHGYATMVEIRKAIEAELRGCPLLSTVHKSEKTTDLRAPYTVKQYGTGKSTVKRTEHKSFPAAKMAASKAAREHKTSIVVTDRHGRVVGYANYAGSYKGEAKSTWVTK